jgi:hypothetical protein
MLAYESVQYLLEEIHLAPSNYYDFGIYATKL